MSKSNKIEQHLGEKIVSERSLGGGCIGNARRLVTESGKQYFIKSYSGSDASILKNEVNGLIELAKPDCIRVPKVVYSDEKSVVLEFIQSGRKRSDFFTVFGKQFADMHRYTSEKYGFFENNFIGSSPQKNVPQMDSWIDFYWENRLLFQLRLSEKTGQYTRELKDAFVKLEKRLPEILADSEEKPTLLHGDLWGGNYMVDSDGNPVLIDPAVYYGHREADLAMTKIFGGFDREFYCSYIETFPLPDGYEDREDIYKLYHILNHLNIFGSSYYHQSLSLIYQYIR